ncbi:MAG: hypothetical protein WCK11_00610 [Candidatus Falkowbacteria bacterium]
MKKYFNNILSIFLLAILLPMTSGICLESLFDAPSALYVAQATTDNMPSVNNQDACGDTTQPTTPDMPTPQTNNHNSVMPCCVDNSHSSIITLSHPIELAKLLPILILSEVHFNTAVSKPIYYQSPITSPPQLLSLKTTILRV